MNMATNKLSAKRHYLIRPKVCKAQTEKAGIVGLSLPACKIDPEEVSIREDQFATFLLDFCVACEPIANSVNVKTIATSGWFEGPPTTENCVLWEVYWHPTEVGVFNLTFEVTWFTGATCTLHATVTVTPL